MEEGKWAVCFLSGHLLDIAYITLLLLSWPEFTHMQEQLIVLKKEKLKKIEIQYTEKHKNHVNMMYMYIKRIAC